MRLHDDELSTLLRSSLSLFTERVYAQLHPNAPFLPNWHLDLVASKLEAVMEGRIRRLIINVPPRSLKSIMASVGFVAWVLGHRPGMQFICASYGQELADKHALDTRNVISSQWYQRLFPTRLVGTRPAVGDLKTQDGGGRYATSVGGVLTGLGADIIVIDDPLKPDEALSDAARNAANAWIDNTVMSRLNDKKTGAIVVIMQRLHMDDVVGHVQEHGDWEVLSLPAIAEETETHTFETIKGVQTIVRNVGEPLHPAREPLDVLERMRQTLGEYNFAGQYQQRPVPMGGGLVKVAWFQMYESQELPSCFDQVVQSWDTASKDTELADYSVCTTWGVKGAHCYLLHVLRQKLNFPDLKRAVVQQIDSFRPQVVLIEDKASGIQLIQELRAHEISIIKAVKAEGSKVMRLIAQTPRIEGEFVKLPKHAAWLEAYVLELTSFPYARHDDQVDSTAQALAWMAMNAAEPALLTYMRMEAEKARNLASGARRPE